MFGIGRRKTQGQLARAELNQGIGHLRQAVTHAAKGAGATVGPRVQAARGTVAPTAIMVRDRAAAARQAAISKKVKAKNMKAAKKKQKRSRGTMTGLLAAGIVAGLAGAMAMRRRREQQEWTEYDPAATLGSTRENKLEPLREDVDTIVVETPDPTAKVTQADDATTTLNNGKNTAKASGVSAGN